MRLYDVARAAVAAACLFVPASAYADDTDGKIGGEYYFTNNSEAKLDLGSKSFFDQYTQQWPEYLLPYGGKGRGFAYADPDEYNGGTTTWLDGKKYGCYFTTSIIFLKSKQKYVFNFYAAQQNGATPAEKIYDCSITATTDESTGRFTAYPVIEKAKTE